VWKGLPVPSNAAARGRSLQKSTPITSNMSRLISTSADDLPDRASTGEKPPPCTPADVRNNESLLQCQPGLYVALPAQQVVWHAASIVHTFESTETPQQQRQPASQLAPQALACCTASTLAALIGRLLLELWQAVASAGAQLAASSSHAFQQEHAPCA
jgi:hypothetical protein